MIPTYIENWLKRHPDKVHEWLNANVIVSWKVVDNDKIETIITPLYEIKPGRKRGRKGLTPDQTDTILRSFDNGDTLTQIGNEFGLSRERIRQICLLHGRIKSNLPDWGVKSRIRNQEKADARNRRFIRILLLSEYWKSGLTDKEMIEAGGWHLKTHKGVSKISLYRKAYGTELFPYRAKRFELKFKTI